MSYINEDLKVRTAELEAANRELQTFIYSVSHDLRAPLRHIAGFSKLLAEEAESTLSERGREYLKDIRESTLEMGQLLDDLLNLARVSRKELEVRLTELDPIVLSVISQLEVKDRSIEWKIGKLPPLECDAGLVKQVFVNLLSNAVKFTRPCPTATIEVGYGEENGRQALFVRDNGVGFNMKTATRLFGVFQRMHRQEEFEGTGVGLAIVERIVQKHGGEIWAKAEVHHGAEFFFTLPDRRESL